MTQQYKRIHRDVYTAYIKDIVDRGLIITPEMTGQALAEKLGSDPREAREAVRLWLKGEL